MLLGGIQHPDLGHGVGMSQMGADKMAATGSTYVQILSKYYSGTTLTA